MIRVTVEMVPRGNEAKKRTLHVIEIWNNLAETVQSKGRRGGYRFRISRKLGPHNPNRKGEMRWQHDGEISGFPRASKNAVHLLRSVLNEAYYGDAPVEVPDPLNPDDFGDYAGEGPETRSTEPSWARGDYDAALKREATEDVVHYGAYPDEGAYRAMRDPAYQDDPLPDNQNYALQYQRKGR